VPAQELVGLLDDAQSYSDSLRGFTREELVLMAEVGRCVVVEEGGVLVREDAPAHVVGVLLSGLADVRCSRNEEVARMQVWKRMTPCLLPRTLRLLGARVSGRASALLGVVLPGTARSSTGCCSTAAPTHYSACSCVD